MSLRKILRKTLTSIFVLLSIVIVISLSQGIQDLLYLSFSVFLKSSWYKQIVLLFWKWRDIVLYIWCSLLIIQIVKEIVESIIVPLLFTRKWQTNITLCTECNLQHELYNFVFARDKSCFLLDGAWGVGKTWQVDKFSNDLKQSGLRKVYRVSCFGLSDRESITKELFKICESSDHSIRKRLVDLIRHTPVIGDLLHSILKNSYDIESISIGSVFIFDDFERISTNFLAEPYRRGTHSSSLKEIDSQFDDIYSQISKLSLLDSAIVATQYAEKFSVVIGFINELIENYKMRVIIIANLSIIPYKIIRDSLESKLNCRKYHLTKSDTLIKDTILTQISRNASLDDKKRQLVSQYFNYIMNEVITSCRLLKMENLRILCSIVNAFMLVIEQNEFSLIKDQMNNIFFSILISHFENEFGNDMRLKYICIGENPLVYDMKYFSSNRYYRDSLSMQDYLTNTQLNCTLKWVGNKIGSGYIYGNYNLLMSEEDLQKINSFSNDFGIAKIDETADQSISPVNLDDFIRELKDKHMNDSEKFVSLLNEGSVDFYTYSCAYIAHDELSDDKYIILSDLLSILEPHDRIGQQKEIRMDETLVKLFYKKFDLAYPWFRDEYKRRDAKTPLHYFELLTKQETTPQDVES